MLEGLVSVLHDVHVHTEGDVLSHDQHIRHRDARQQQVDGVGPHVLRYYTCHQQTDIAIDNSQNTLDQIYISS